MTELLSPGSGAYDFYHSISMTRTPKYDDFARKIIAARPDGKPYVTEAYMRDRLDFYFPGWSWEAYSLEFLGSEWVVASGHLIIHDNGTPRRFWGSDAVRIQYRQSQPHTPENIIDIGDNVQSAISGALKRAINRLCHIADDIYQKQVELDNGGQS